MIPPLETPPVTNNMSQAHFTVSTNDAGIRLDVYLNLKLDEISRSQVAKLAQGGHIYLNGKPAKPSLKLKAGDEVRVEMPCAMPSQYLPENLPLEILYEDLDILVLNKPAGMVVHPAPGHDNGTLVNAVLHHCPDLGAIAGEIRPGIVHRLDQDTSGVMVVAKNNVALENLTEQFKSRKTQKIYLALVLGHMEGAGEVDAAIGRALNDRKRMSVVSKHKREALTKWRALKDYNSVSLLKIRILTGRTHQIRVHMAHLRHPIVGDQLYGVKNIPQVLQNYGVRDARLYEILQPITRQMLHAYRLSFSHPQSGQHMRFCAPPPADFTKTLAQLEACLTEINPENEVLDVREI